MLRTRAKHQRLYVYVFACNFLAEHMVEPVTYSEYDIILR